MADAQVGVVITADDQITQTLSGITKSLQGLQPAFKTAALVGGAAFAAISGAIYTSVEAANDSAKVQAQLGAVLKSTGGAAGLYIEDLNDQALALQKVTTYSDEAVNSAQGLLLTFTNIKGGVFQQSIGTILDMSTALGQDLKSSAIQVGKALNDPVKGITALQRVGVSFSEAQKKVIETLATTGHLAEAQQLILKELNTEFGGSASAAAQTYAGKVEILKNQFNDFQEKVGQAVIPALEKLVAIISPIVEKMTAWASEHPQLIAGILGLGLAVSGIITLVGVLGVALGGLATTAVALGTTLGALLGWMLLIPIAIAALIVAGYELYTHWGEITSFISYVWGATIDYVSDKMLAASDFIMAQFTAVKNWITLVLNAISNIWKSTWGGIGSFFSDVWNGITSSLKAAVDFVAAQVARLQALLAPVTNKISSIGGSISSGFNSVLNAGKSALGIHDGIVQGGQVITTDPADYIIATKHPENLAGGGKSINININGAIFSQDAARTLGNILIGQLQVQTKF